MKNERLISLVHTAQVREVNTQVKPSDSFGQVKFSRLANNDACDGDERKAVTASNGYLSLQPEPAGDETHPGAPQPGRPDDIAIKVGQLK